MSSVDLPAEQIRVLCDKHLVQRLELFGSAATGRFDPSTSDFDFIVSFRPMPLDRRSDSYFGLLFALEDLLSRRVDLIELEAVRNPYFRQSLQLTPKRVVYDTR